MEVLKIPYMSVEMPGGGCKEFRLIKNCYFKAEFGGPSYISGLALPNPSSDYYFEDCIFHPGLYDILKEKYMNSIFVNCEK